SSATRSGCGRPSVRRSTGLRIAWKGSRGRVATASGRGGRLRLRVAVRAAVHLALELSDVRLEVDFLLREPLLERGELPLPLVELVLANLVVGLEPRVARLDVGLPLVDLTQPRGEALLRLDEPLLLLRHPPLLGVGDGFD